MDFASLISHVKTASGSARVFKDECMYSFDNPESEHGLYVCLASFLGFGKKHVEDYFKKSGHRVYLNIRRTKIELPSKEEDSSKKPKRLAIGVEGGFSTDEKQYEIKEQYSLVVLPDWTTVPYPDGSIPSQIDGAVKSVLSAESAQKKEELTSMAGTWDGEVRQISKYARNLKQLPAHKKIPPSNWKCEQCDLRDNLWLNLTDGSILCGRRFWDGSGGNNHAVEQYQQSGYPLSVKLGTITPSGGDVFSYSEDDMVEDPLLAQHLAHWGIDIMKMTKTEKTMTELEIDINQKIGEWDVIQEAGSQLLPAYGPGYTGMINLGNSCYMNSVMQVLFTLPDMKAKYHNQSSKIFTDCSGDPSLDVPVQLAKLGHGLLSGDYSEPPPPPSENPSEPCVVKPNGIRPMMFKSLIGKGHSEFSTKRQQDAQEFLLHIINIIERNCRGSENPCDCLKFQMEERIECMKSQKVKYKYKTDYILALPIPMEATINKEEVAAYEEKKREAEAAKIPVSGDIVRARVPLAASLEHFIQPAYVEGFYSSAVQGNSTAIKTERVATFPNYLIIQLKKFTLGDDWVPKKLDVSIEMPDDLDLSSLRGIGRQPWEEELPDVKTPREPEIQINEQLVEQLVDMGFGVEGCRKAVYYTKNAGVEAAAAWVMEHMGDPDFDSPLQLGGTSEQGSEASGYSFVPDDEALVMITSMGFTPEQATKALKATNNNVERAADWIFSHAGELDEAMDIPEDEAAAAASQDIASRTNCQDGDPKYKLVAFISHMGTSTMVGHYVCHIKKDGKWVIFNDEKVAFSEKPPRDLGYLYLYQRA